MSIPFNSDEILVETYPATETKGMYAGMRPCGVRVTHKELGLCATCTKHRSQHKNRAAAIDALSKSVDSWLERD